MDGRLIALLASVGVVVGFVSLLPQWPLGAEPLVWIGFALAVWLPILVKRRVDRPFLTGFLVSVAAGSLAGLTRAAFISTFLANHPEARDANATETQLAYASVLWGTIIGALYGLVVGWACLVYVRRAVAIDANAPADQR